MKGSHVLRVGTSSVGYVLTVGLPVAQSALHAEAAILNASGEVSGVNGGASGGHHVPAVLKWVLTGRWVIAANALHARLCVDDGVA
jgi:Zn-dependent alcohol dehydrogenase